MPSSGAEVELHFSFYHKSPIIVRANRYSYLIIDYLNK